MKRFVTDTGRTLSRIEWIGAVIFLIAILLTISGCSHTRYAVQTPVCPPRPSLPIIMEVEFDDIAHDTYVRLVERELALLDYIGELKTLCRD